MSATEVTFRGVVITSQQRQWASRVWLFSKATDAEWFAHAAAGYEVNGPVNWALLDWQNLGEAVQNELVLLFLRLEQNMRKAHR